MDLDALPGLSDEVKVPNDECVGVIADSCKMYINL